MTTGSNARPLVYLASPYSHDDPAVREARYHSACVAAGRLMQLGYVVFSPIAHSHGIAEHGGLPGSWEHWKTFDETYIGLSRFLFILKIDGWQESRGVAAEIEIARRSSTTVVHLSAEWGDKDCRSFMGEEAIAKLKAEAVWAGVQP